MELSFLGALSVMMAMLPRLVSWTRSAMVAFGEGFKRLDLGNGLCESQ